MALKNLVQLQNLGPDYKIKRLEMICDIARSKGGICLSDSYKNVSTKMDFRCKNGHEWSATPRGIIKGSWCPDCGIESMKKKLQNKFDDIKKIITNRGGKCLSKEYKNTLTKLSVICDKGHSFKITATSLKNGSWCEICGIERAKEKTTDCLETFIKIAKDHGGECLSDTYVNNRVKLKFRCKEGHEWEAQPHHVKRGHWCKICSFTDRNTGRKFKKNRNFKEQLAEILKEKSAVCHTKNIERCTQKVDFTCKYGHSWSTTPQIIINGHWCPKCMKKDVSDRLRDKIETFKKVAEDHGGECLSDSYTNGKSILKFRCKEGHIFETEARNLKRGCWCPECGAKNAREKNLGSFDEIKKIAEEKGGKCLSDTYINCYTKLKFQCKRGHIWEVAPRSVKAGSWCRACHFIEHKLDYIRRSKE